MILDPPYDWSKLERVALSVIDHAVVQFEPSHVFAMFSGGHDSLTATRIASKHPQFSGCLHINTGIGVEETREFVRETCKREGWPLREYRAKDCGQDYEDLVLERGFPGPAHHYKMYNRLKERPLRQAIRETKQAKTLMSGKTRHQRFDRILLVTGCRSQESTRRMGHVEPIQQEGVKVWVAPVHDWDKTMCNKYIARERLPRNPVVDLIHMSGECLCGAFAHKGELSELALWYPRTADHIKDLERRVRQEGHDWGWEGSPPRRGGVRDSAGRIKKRQELCQTCILNEGHER